MISIVEYEPTLFEDAVDIFSKLSSYYLKENSSSRDAVRENLEQNVLAPGSSVKIVLAYYDGAVCALASYAILYPATKETGQMFLKELFVAPEYSRKGVGMRMMSFLSKIALDRNCSRFDWTTQESNTKAINFYEKIGAAPMESKKYYRLSRNELQKVIEMDIK